MNIDNLTIGEAKQLASIFSNTSAEAVKPQINCFIGEKVIVRTYSAGVHFGTLQEKCGNEVILKDARRLWRWKTKSGISLSEVSKTGLDDSSKVCVAVESIWMEAIEIIPCQSESIESIEAQNVYKA